MKIVNLSIGLLLGSSLLLGSCSDFLKEDNRSGLTEDQFYVTEVGAESLVNSCYTPVRFWYGKEGGIALTELGTDLIIAGAGCTHFPLARYEGTSLNGKNSNLQVYWERFYAAINSCNTALQYLPSSALSAQVKAARLGEIHFLRAFYYWHIEETWGDVPLNLTPINTMQTTAYKATKDQVFDQIMADLDDAIKELTVQVADANGRITLPAAKAFKARMLLTRASATYLTSPNRAKDYADAAALAKEVIANYGFSLSSNYTALWNMANTEGSKNKEVVWYVNYTSDLTLAIDEPQYAVTNSFRKDGGNQLHVMFCMKYDDQPGMLRDINNGRPYNRYMPSLHYLQLFDQTMDQRYAGTFKSVWIANDQSKVAAANGKGYPLMTVGDTAICILPTVATAAQKAAAAEKYELLDANDIYANGHDKTINVKQYIQFAKFDDPTRASANELRSARDAFVIRISEMYLIVAEAELNSNPTEALQYMNTLREKRAIPGKEAAMDITLSQLNLDFILAERGRELGGEQIRWFDLKRTGKLLDYVRAWNPDGKLNIRDYHVVRPIPQSQLDVITNKDEFTQNPGYN